jgi:hypothetical protein
MKPLCTTLTLLTLWSVAAWPVASQEQTGEVEADPLFSVLFAPELIMQHRRAIGLTGEQRDAISGMIQEAQGKVVQLQWELLDQVQELTEVLDRTRVDVDLALDRMDHVLDTEKRVKQAHLELLVGIKNLLSDEQQAMLRRLRDESRSDGGSGPPDQADVESAGGGVDVETAQGEASDIHLGELAPGELQADVQSQRTLQVDGDSAPEGECAPAEAH